MIPRLRRCAAFAALSYSLATPAMAGVEIRGATGLGSFQDIQVPANEPADQRGDGTPLGQENQTHTGFPLMAGIGYAWQASNRLHWELLDLDALQMRASTGPTETQSSSYSRISLMSQLAYSFPMGSLTGLVGANAGVRRSAWTNISEGHYLNAGLVEGRVGIKGASMGLEAYGGAAPVAHFGYSTQPLFGGEDFKKSSASLNVMGLQFSNQLRPNAWLDLGFEREEAAVKIDDVNEYNNFGLNVFNPDDPSRSYDLVTTVVHVGIRKSF